MKNKTAIGIVIVAVVIGGFVLSRQPDGSNESAGTPLADVASLAGAKSPETVELKNGDVYDLVAEFIEKEINGNKYRMLAYNGSIPGPLIKVDQGAEVTLNFKNATDMDTTIHSHGVRLDNQFDGVPDVTQETVRPGGAFTYKIKFPDAGMFWYHPHVREDYQQELGLYGNYLVVPKTADYWSPVNREVPIFLDDILIENGKIILSKEGADHTLMGRFGNVMLVNGETDYQLEARRGEAIRFYVTNSANTRPFRFAVDGARMKLTGADGGAYEQDAWADGVTLSPSERAVVEVLFDEPGSYAIENRTPEKTFVLGAVNVSTAPIDVSYAAQFETLSEHRETIASIDPFRTYFSKAPDKRLALSIDMMGQMMQMQGMGHGGHMMPNGQMMGGSMMSPGPDGIEWEDGNQMMNEMSDTSMIRWKIVDQDTGKENMNINWSFPRGEPVKIRIFNDPKSMHPMQHPIHFHGQRFLVLTENGRTNTNLVWKDTVLVPSGQTVDILLDTSNPGTWMTHCHIAEHLEAGMMFAFEVQ